MRLSYRIRQAQAIVFSVLLLATTVSWTPPAYARPAAEPGNRVGQHRVQLGDTLYSLGRAYGVLPEAIAEANGLGPLAWLEIGQVLFIPAAPWAAIPSGPVSQPQFQSPFPALAPNLNQPFTPAGANPAGVVPPGRSALTPHQVRGGETLFSIGRAYGVDPIAIAAANGLTFASLIYPGQGLVIPAVPWAQIEPGPVAQPQILSPVGFTPPSGTTWLPANTGNVFVPTFAPVAPGAWPIVDSLGTPLPTPLSTPLPGGYPPAPGSLTEAPPEATAVPAPEQPTPTAVPPTPATPPASGYPAVPPPGYP